MRGFRTVSYCRPSSRRPISRFASLLDVAVAKRHMLLLVGLGNLLF